MAVGGCRLSAPSRRPREEWEVGVWGLEGNSSELSRRCDAELSRLPMLPPLGSTWGNVDWLLLFHRPELGNLYQCNQTSFLRRNLN